MFVRCRPFLLIFVLALILPALLIACGSEAPTERPASDRATAVPEATAASELTSAPITAPAAQEKPSATTGAPALADAPSAATATPLPTFTPPPTATPVPTPMAPAPSVPQLAQPSPETDREALFAFYKATDGENWIQPQLAERRANRRVGGSHHRRQWPRHRTGPPREPVERGATTGVGQPHQSDTSVPPREPVEWVHTRQPTRSVGYAVFRPGWSAVLLRRRRAPQWSRPK